MNDEGPQPIVTQGMSCVFCKYLRSKVDVYGTFSNQSRHWCMHPAHVRPDLPIELQAKIKERGQYIGHEDNTPRWCPFMTDEAA